jgi:hypothetical protein
MLAQKIGYRVIDSEKFKLDGLIGFRYWHLANTLTLQPQIASGFYGSAHWVDAVGGARFQAMLSPKVTFTVLGDAGSGGANLDYQIAEFPSPPARNSVCWCHRQKVTTTRKTTN